MPCPCPAPPAHAWSWPEAAGADGVPVHFGVILGYQGPQDYYLLGIEHGSADTTIQLYHCTKAQVRPISTARSVTFAETARRAWITMHLDIWEKSLLVKLGKAGKQVIWIGKSVPGNLGLFLRVREDHHGIKFRNLAVEAKKAGRQ